MPLRTICPAEAVQQQDPIEASLADVTVTPQGAPPTGEPGGGYVPRAGPKEPPPAHSTRNVFLDPTRAPFHHQDNLRQVLINGPVMNH